MVFELVGGERGIRTPGPVTVNGFQDRRIRPLCHLSAAKIHPQVYQPKKYKKEFGILFSFDDNVVIFFLISLYEKSISNSCP